MSIGQALGLLVFALMVLAGIVLLRRRRSRGGRRGFGSQSRVRTWSKSDKWSPWR
jgi:hypothetical protein